MSEPSKPSDLPVIANADVARDAEKAALQVQNRLQAQALPIRQYLEATVVPTVMQGMQALIRERPDDPLEYLGTYLLKEARRKKGVKPTIRAAGAAQTAPGPK